MAKYNIAVKRTMPAQRPERFAWDDEEAAFIFGEPSQKAYDPNQPRYPAGTSRGGQFAPKGGTEQYWTLSDERYAHLPESVANPFSSWEDVQRFDAESQAQFADAMGQVAKEMNLRTDLAKPKEMTPADIASDDGFLFIGRPKDFERAHDKVTKKYKGDWSRLTDAVRGTISVKTAADIDKAIKAFEKTGLKFAAQPDNRFAHPTNMGYRDFSSLVRLPNGTVAELQFHVKAITTAKNVMHKEYDITRAIEERYDGDKAPTAKWSASDVTVWSGAATKQRTLYDEAWKIATNQKGGK